MTLLCFRTVTIIIIQMKPQEALTNEAKRLQYQLTIVNDLNKKLSQELRTYQQKYNIPIKKHTIKPDQLQFTNLSEFMQELFYIEPLLLSYQNKIAKLEDLVQQLQFRSSSFEEKAYQLTSENDFLREELEEKCKNILQREAAVTGIDIKYLRLENQGLRDKEKLIKEENEALRKQIMKLRDRVEELDNREEKEREVRELEVEVERAKERERKMVIENLTLGKELELLKTKYKNDSVIADTNNQTIMRLESELSKHSNENKLLSKKVETLTNTHYHTITQLESQNSTLKSQLKETQRHEANLLQKNLSVQNQIQNKHHDTHNLQLKLTTLENNNTNLLEMIESYQGKLGQLKTKLRLNDQSLKQQSQKMKELMKERDILAWKLEETEERLARKDEEGKLERERFAKAQNERVAVWKRSSEVEKERIEDQLSNIRSEYTNLQERYTRATKDKTGAGFD